jgi:hypothetical protein
MTITLSSTRLLTIRLVAAAASAIDLVRVSGSNVGFEQGSILYGLIFLASQHVCQTRDAYSASMFCVEHASSV